MIISVNNTERKVYIIIIIIIINLLHKYRFLPSLFQNGFLRYIEVLQYNTL